MRPDLTVSELLALTAGVAWAGERAGDGPDLMRRLLSLVVEGISA